MAVQEPLDVGLAERLDDLLLQLDQRHPREDVLVHAAHPPAPGEEGLDLAVPAVLVGGTRAALAEVLQKRVDVRHGVRLGSRRESNLLTDAAEVGERGAIAPDRLGGLALHLAGCEVGRNHVVDRGHRDLPSVYAVGTSLTHTRDQSKSKVYSVPCTTGLSGHREPEAAPRARDLPRHRRWATMRRDRPSMT